MKKKKIVDVEQLYIDYSILGTEKTCKKHNLNSTFLRYTLKNNGYHITGIRRKYDNPRKSIYNFNEHYFDVIDTANKAYLLGILATDGCVSTNRNVISLAIHKKDLSIIEFFKKELNANNRVLAYKNYVSIHFSSKIMKESLISLGITNRKTHTIKYPNIPVEFNYDFLRGCIDGDGCWSISPRTNVYSEKIKSRITLQISSGSYSFLESIQQLLSKETKSLSKIYKFKNKNCFELKYGGSKQCKKFFDIIYYDKTFFSLKRKFDIVNSYYEQYKN